MSTPNDHSADVVLILDPRRDQFAPHVAWLQAAQMSTRLCGAVQDFCTEFVKPDIACAVIVDDVLTEEAAALIGEVVRLQPSWRDLPLLVLGSSASSDVEGSDGHGIPNALYLSAPVAERTLVSVVQLAQRYGARQSAARHSGPEKVQVDSREAAVIAEVPNKRPIQVLLVDDHEIVLKGLRGVMAFYKDIEVVGEARSGIEAMTKAEELQPQVIIMDVNMPMGNGIEVTRAIKSAFPSITIIGLSVYNDSAVVNSMREAGADAFFEKGIDENVIHAAIQAHSQRTANATSGN